jgi:hypothetical protein
LWSGAGTIPSSSSASPVSLILSHPFCGWESWDLGSVNDFLRIMHTVTQLRWPHMGPDLLIQYYCTSKQNLNLNMSWEKRYSRKACGTIILLLCNLSLPERLNNQDLRNSILLDDFNHNLLSYNETWRWPSAELWVFMVAKVHQWDNGQWQYFLHYLWECQAKQEPSLAPKGKSDNSPVVNVGISCCSG